MAQVSWNGTIMDDGEGVAVVTTVGVRQRVKEHVPLLRSDGEAVKYYGTTGADIPVELTFLRVADVQTLRNNLTGFSLEDRTGTLTVASHGSFFNCSLASVSELQIERNTKGISTANPIGTGSEWTVKVTMTFRQLR